MSPLSASLAQARGELSDQPQIGSVDGVTVIEEELGDPMTLRAFDVTLQEIIDVVACRWVVRASRDEGGADWPAFYSRSRRLRRRFGRHELIDYVYRRVRAIVITLPSLRVRRTRKRPLRGARPISVRARLVPK